MAQITALYVRDSSKSQDTAGQLPDLRRWASGQKDQANKWYRDKVTGRPMDRPGFDRLMADVEAGKVSRIVVWRLDRLGRPARELTALLEELMRRGVNLISLKDGLDLATLAGRLMTNVLASVAAYESEARAERIVAGQAAAREAGKTWGGSPKGRRLKVTVEQEAMMRRMKREGDGITSIARATGLSRPTIYRILSSEATTASPSRKKRKPRSQPRG